MSDLDLKELPIPELDRVLLRKRMIYDNMFTSNFRNNCTEILLEKIKHLTKNKQNVIIDFYGQPRSGKSWGALSIAGQSPQPPTIDNVYFTLDEINKNLAHLKDGDTVIRDEVVEPFGVGTLRLDIEYTIMIETLGKKSINFYIISPLPRATEHCFYFIQSLRLIDYKKGINYMELQDNTMDTLGHLQVKNPIKVLGQPFIDEYEKKKDEFLSVFLRKKSVDYISDYAREITKCEEFLKVEKILKDKATKKKRGFAGISHKYLLELVNLKHPELRRNVEAKAVVDKINYIGLTEREWLKG